MLDLDWFKRINDQHGHVGGDDVLRKVAAELGRLVRVEDVFARYGGEEFVLVVRSTPHDDALRLAERVREAVAALPLTVGGAPVTMTASIGVASFSELDAKATPEDLIALADRRLYRAKAAGRNQVCGAS
jgi:diguanylate cyclase (GGDEF)-like protein